MQVTVKSTLNASADKVWEALRTFDKVETYISMVTKTELDGQGVGSQRICTAMNPDDPHFYYKEKIIVLYVGDDPAIEELLESVLGSQFAGR